MVSNIVPAGKIAGKLSDHYDGPHDQRPGRHGYKVFPELRLHVVTVFVLILLTGGLFDPGPRNRHDQRRKEREHAHVQGHSADCGHHHPGDDLPKVRFCHCSCVLKVDCELGITNNKFL